MKNNELFIMGESIASSYIKKYEYPFEVLPNIKDIIMDIGKNLDSSYELIDDNIWISKTVTIPKNVTIIGPCIIDHNAEIRPGAYIRGKVIIGKNSVLGNSCEIKNAILYDHVQVPHFNYVGDSILGCNVHLGAGVILANLRFDKKNIKVEGEETNLRKIGAFIGDNTEIGCNSVVFPGTVIMPDSVILPLSKVNGKYPNDKIRPQRI